MRFSRFMLVLPLLPLLASCAAQPPAVQRELLPNEIADHPQILFDGSVPLDAMTLRGVKLGDAGSAIDEKRIEKRADAGWIVCNDGARYRVADDKVITLAAWDTAILKRLNLKTPEDIELRFGKAESSEDVAPVIIYYFRSGRVSVLWNTFEKQVNAVNVAKAP
jgi:hypothetical protein